MPTFLKVYSAFNSGDNYKDVIVSSYTAVKN